MTIEEVSGISGVVGLVLPVVVDFVNAKITSTKVRFWISLGISFLAALLITYIGGGFDTTNLLASLGVVFTLSQTLYKTYWKDSDARATVVAKFGGKPE